MPGILYQFLEKRVAFARDDIMYIYSTMIDSTPEPEVGTKLGSTIVAVWKIFRSENSLIILLAKQIKVDKAEREEYVYSRMYLAFKNSLIKRLEYNDKIKDSY